jgi:hypothetical protein
MRIQLVSGAWLALCLAATAGAQSTSLTRTEVAALKAKIVAVQQAMGTDPAGYMKNSEDFDLPTDANPAQGGKFWPITSGVSLRYEDRAAAEAEASAEQRNASLQARMQAAVAAGNFAELTRISQEAAQAQAGAMGPRKEPMYVNVRMNQNPVVGIDPDAVVLEQAGVIVLREKDSDAKGTVTVYADPVALRATQELSKIELRTAQDGVSNKTGVYHVVIDLNGTLADLEAWVQTFDYAKILGVIDAR